MDLTALAQMFKMDIQQTLAVAAAIVFILNLLKEQVGLQGKLILLVDAILSIGLAALIYKPDVVAITFAAIVYFIGSAGPWESAKILAHKVGVPKT